MGQLTFILGGARSGKSSYAQRLAEERGGSVLFIATAQAGDEEMRTRITRHQAERPDGWATLEAPVNIASALDRHPGSAETVVLDCVTLLVTNLLLEHGGDDGVHEAAAQAAVEAELAALTAAIRSSAGDWIVVSNEVGLGLVPAYPLGRAYRDLLGWANQRLASWANEVFYLVAGIPVPVHKFRD
jgi:adenosylcobinamide kinase/adenosylcobinamide-phosphate guanylyltransferase